jgi:predicted permease
MGDALALFATAASPVATAGLLAAAGAALAARGVLDARGAGTLAALSFNLFTPALTFSTLAASITLERIQHLWPLLANMAVSCSLGVGAGFAAARALKVPPELRAVVACAIAFGNVGNMPLVLVNSICGDPASLVARALGPDCERLGVSYTAIDIAAATLFQFTLAIYLLRPTGAAAVSAGAGVSGGGSGALRSADDLELPPAVEAGAEVELPPLAKTLTLSNLLALRGGGSAESTPRGRESPAPAPRPSPPPPPPGALALEMHPAGPSTGEGAPLLGGGSHARAAAATSGHSTTAPPWWRRAARRVAAADWAALLPPPALACLAGLAVGCTPPVRALLYGPSPPLRVVARAIDQLAAGLIPAAIPLLGAVLYNARGAGGSRLPGRVIAGSVVARLVLLGGALTTLAYAAFAAGIFRPPDPMVSRKGIPPNNHHQPTTHPTNLSSPCPSQFTLSLLLSNVTPTAINMLTLCVISGRGAGEMSRLLLAQYGASLVALPLWTFLFLRIIQALHGEA